MRIGMIGLGRMGGNIARRLQRSGHQPVVFDRNPDAVAELALEGFEPADSLEEIKKKLGTEAIFWVMLPAGEPTEKASMDIRRRPGVLTMPRWAMSQPTPITIQIVEMPPSAPATSRA